MWTMYTGPKQENQESKERALCDYMSLYFGYIVSSGLVLDKFLSSSLSACVSIVRESLLLISLLTGFTHDCMELMQYISTYTAGLASL